MKDFTVGKVIRRTVKIRSSDRALPDTEWVLSLGADGVRIRKLGAPKSDAMHLSWRSIVGHALIHRSAR